MPSQHYWLGTYAQRVYTHVGPPLWVDKGISLCRLAGVYSERMILTDTDTATFDLILRGGYKMPITGDIYAELVSAGFDAYVSYE